MAVTMEVDEDLLRQWAATRPAVVQQMIQSHPPGRLYQMEPTGSRVEIESYAEDGTVTVSITGQYNLVVFNRSVFGVLIENLTECELPLEGELLGSPDLSRQEIEEMRALMRQTDAPRDS